ncbi:MAG TPA: LysR substrate-binding domain-containing protein [Methylotenera sp.]|jgi:LysR family transcriptional regulator, low CO2-responsive transcriptional regulator|nr:LysR substrate-binding domain-containing protein [Methylotenera sp.]HPV33012.1 LysR substrate-binding domain-containing protein [Methylotenera sp.]
MRNLTLRQVRIFLSAYKHMSFARAAEELCITAPAVSQQIKEMEQDMGVNMFIRENRKIELTSAGEYFLLYARKMLSTVNEADVMMERLRGTQMKTLNIGLVSTAKYFLPHLIAEFKKDFPNLKIKMEARNRQQLVELLRDGEIDIAIMGQPPKEMDTRVEAFAKHPHAFIANAQHALAGKLNITPDELNSYEVISRELGSGTRFIMEKYFTEHQISPIVSMQISSIEAIKQAVIANLGITFTSLHTVGSEISNRQLVVLDVQETPIMRTWHVVALNKHNNSQAAEAFRYFMLEKGGTLLNEMFKTIVTRNS